MFKKDDFNKPVDPELFLWCSGIYQAAADLSMPTPNPENRPVFQDGEDVYSFKDIPVNRGLLAVTKELNELDTPDDQRLSICTRLMHFGEVLKSKELSEFIKPGEEPGALAVSEALIKACATAKLLISKKSIRYDIKDLKKIAKRLTDEEKSA